MIICDSAEDLVAVGRGDFPPRVLLTWALVTSHGVLARTTEGFYCSLTYEDLRLEQGPHGAIRWPSRTDKMGRETVVPINASTAPHGAELPESPSGA